MAIKLDVPLRYFAQKSVTRTILRGSLIAALILTVLLAAHDLLNFGGLRGRLGIALIVIAYLCLGEVLMRTRYHFWVNWLLIVLFTLIAGATLLVWGINTPVGILTTGFVVILPSLLIDSRRILPVTVAVIAIVFGIQFIHEINLFTPDTASLHVTPTYWDAGVYAAILIVFALVSWLSRHQIEASLLNARKAEAKVKKQKEALREELQKESTRLREAQLQDIQHLHKFAFIGQSTAATLHELANHLSVLNFDLDDIRDHTSVSTKEAIENAHESIQAIQQVVQAARRQLNNYSDTSKFLAAPTLYDAFRDLDEKAHRKHVRLNHDISAVSKRLTILGDPNALIQVVTILATNAMDACLNFKNPTVTITATTRNNKLLIHVDDTGMGVSEEAQKSLFSPGVSSKPSGLGVGLYIANHITQTHLKGTITFKNQQKGARFTLTLPYSKKHTT